MDASDQPGQRLVAPSSGPRLVKIYGERNTGTTYLERLLESNLHVDCLVGGVPRRARRWLPKSEAGRDLYFRLTWRWNLGWKHAVAPDRARLARSFRRPGRLLFLTLTKNPYSWLLSLYRRPYHQRREIASFEEFLSSPWPTVARENAPACFASPIELWNVKNAAYRDLAEHAPVVSWRYEDLLADPLGLIGALARERGLVPRREAFQNVEEAVKARDHGKRHEDYRDYYLNERWREEIDARAIQRIDRELDPSLLDHFGYERLGTPS